MRYNGSGLGKRSKPRATVEQLTSEAVTRWAIYALVMVGNLIQRPGRTTFDTKLDLLIDPRRFMGSATSLWDPSVSMGQIGNQSYGYLFPMGPYFAIGDMLGVPMWVWQRAWSALLLLVALEGARRVVRALGIGPWPSLIGAVAYAFAPRLVATVGVLSGESLASVVLPWVVLPLVRAARGQLGWWAAVLRSAVTVLFMGGHNATEVLAALALPFAVVALGVSGLRRRATLVWGLAGAYLMACAWWLGPLLVMGGYAPPFLDYIESAANVTAPVDWFASLRGATHWVGYLPTDVSHWQAANDVTYMPVLVVVGALLAGVGLVGLTHASLPLGRPFLAAVVLALAVMALGHGDWPGSPWAEGFRSLLDGPLAPIRNIHKFDPVARLGLAVGLASAVQQAPNLVFSARRTHTSRSGSVAVPVAIALSFAGAVTMALPIELGHVRADDGWKEIPLAWNDVESFLSAQGPEVRALVVPGAGFASQTWGRTVDEVLQTSPTVRWASRSQVPLAPAASIRLLDGFSRAFQAGRPHEKLAAWLGRSGFSHVVLRHDLASTADAVSSTQVLATLVGSPGFTREGKFGTTPQGRPAIEVFAVDGKSGVRAVNLDEVGIMSGSPESVGSALLAGVMDANRPYVDPADAEAIGRREVDALIQPQVRREHNFGRVTDADSAILGEMDDYTLARRAHDYTDPRSVIAFGQGGNIASVRTSSGTGRADTIGPVRAGQGSWAALDGLIGTHWASDPYTSAVGQWLEVSLTKPQAIPRVSALFNQRDGAHIRRVTITTDVGTPVVVGVPASGLVTATLPTAPVQRVRVTVSAVDPQFDGQVVMAQLGLAGIDPQRTIVRPGSISPTDVVFSTSPGVRSCFETPRLRCPPGVARQAEESAALDRTFTTDEERTWTISGWAVADSAQGVSGLLAPLNDKAVRIGFSTALGDNPLVAGSHAFDGDEKTTWVADPADPEPSLDLSWGVKKSVRAITVIGGAVPGRRPDRVVIEGGGSRREVVLGTAGTATFKPIRANRLTLRFPGMAGSSVVVSELQLSGLEGMSYQAPPAQTITLPCGLGPTVTLNGRKIRTSLTASRRDILAGRRVPFVGCGGPEVVAAGEQRIRAVRTPGFMVTEVKLGSLGSRPRAKGPVVTVREWGAEARAVDVSDGGPALLVVPENENHGWVARLAGRELITVRVDGWMQGWIIPAGEGRQVSLTFEPGHTYRVALGTGAALAVVLVLLALFTSRRTAPTSSFVIARTNPTRRAGVLGAVAVVLGLIGGPVVALSTLAVAVTPRQRHWEAGIIGGVIAAPVLAALIWLRHYDSNLPSALSAAAVGAAVGMILRLRKRTQA